MIWLWLSSSSTLEVDSSLLMRLKHYSENYTPDLKGKLSATRTTNQHKTPCTAEPMQNGQC